MAAGSQNPLRQAMINMMYLVLLALMALNVSAQVLKAFETVHEGIAQSNESLTQKNQSTMQRFRGLLENDRERTLPHYKRAQKAQAIGESLVEYIDSLKKRIIQESGGYLEDSTTLAGAKNLDVGTRILVTKDKGDTLQRKINETREEFINILEPYNQDTISQNDIPLQKIKNQIPLKAEDPPKGPDHKNSWAAANFEMIPVTAAVTLLTKIQSDVKNTQSEILSTLLNQVGKSGMTFDVFTPIVKTEKSAVSVNEQFEAQIMLGAYSSTQNPTITVKGNKIPVENGKGKFTMTPTSSGEKTLPGTIKIKDPSSGDIRKYPFTINFNAFKAPAIISADAMNVLYTGLKNPISVSVPGYRPQQIRASLTTGKLIKQKPGHYIAKVPSTRNTFVNVSVKKQDGSTKSVGKKKFRIKPVPKPTPYFGSKASGNISAGEVKIVDAIVASMGEGFAFEGVKYVVSEFRLTYVPRRGNFKEATANGPRLTSEMERMLANPKPGDKIIVDQIYATGPDGEKRLPTAITLTVE